MKTGEGTVQTADHGLVKIHSYAAPEDGLLVNTHVVEGPTRLIVFDTQFLLAYADEVADYLEELGKPVDRIIVSHAHPDHWVGLQVLTRRLPGVPVLALATVRDYIAENGQALIEARQPVFGD